MNIGIIGGSGFIGTRLTSVLLESGHDVRILDIAESAKFPELRVAGDVLDVDAVAEFLEGRDSVVNLAAVHRDDVDPPSLYYETNVDGARSCCEAAVRAGVGKIVFTSSVAVYGFSEPDSDEDAPVDPFNHYGRSKAEAEAVYREWAGGAPGRSLSIVRPTVVFGEGNRGNVYNLIKQVAGKRFLMVGPGKNRKSMAYVGNVAAFLGFLAVSGDGLLTVNYADKPDFDMRSLVGHIREHQGRSGGTGIRVPLPAGYLGGVAFDLLSRITGRKFPISRIRVEKFVKDTSFSSKYLSGTGFVPPFEITDALKRTLDAEFPKAATAGT